MQKGNNEGAKIYAANAIRKKNESLNLLRLSSRIDAVTSRVQTAVTMRAVTGSMGKVVQGMDVAMKTMDLERISAVMDRFEKQFTDLDVQTGYMEDTMNDSTANTTPQEEVDLLLQKVRPVLRPCPLSCLTVFRPYSLALQLRLPQVADEAGIEVQHDLAEQSTTQDNVSELAPADKVTVEEDRLAERLRALRPQAS